MNSLPDKPSEILEVALRDLEVVENLPNYNINMSSWKDRVNNDCYVCHAGAVMVNSLGATDIKITESPCDYESVIASKLHFINHIRRGDINLGLMSLVNSGALSVNKYSSEILKTSPAIEIPQVVSLYYEDHRDTYKLYIQFMIEYFRSEGL